MEKPTLEHAAQQIAEATSKPPFLYDLGPEDARKVLDDIQAAPVPKLEVDEEWIRVPASAGDAPSPNPMRVCMSPRSFSHMRFPSKS